MREEEKKNKEKENKEETFLCVVQYTDITALQICIPFRFLFND